MKGGSSDAPVRGGRAGRLHPRRPGLARPTSGPVRPDGTGAAPDHPRQRGARWPAIAFGDRGAVHLRRLERRDRARLGGEAGGLRPGEEVPGGLPDPRRPAGLLRRPASTTAGIRRSTPAAGYAAVMVDFHGSTGYGQEFTDSIGGDWGGKPLEDLQKGLAAALARYPWMDGDAGGRARRLLRRLHDQLDRRGLARPLPLPGQPRRQPRRAPRLLRHRGALVPGAGARRHALGGPGGLPEAQPGRTS